MIDPSIIGQIVEQYTKHGWTLRRALLSAAGRNAIAKTPKDIAIEDSDLDALWFSRCSNAETEAWELRRLTGSPFALVAVVSVGTGSEELDATLSQVVEEMRAKTTA